MSAIGFPDFRRQVDYDTTAAIVVWDGTPIANATLLGPFNLSNFAYVSGDVAATGAAYLLEFKFYADAAMTQLCGVRRMRCDPAGAGGAQLRLAALGRWMTIRVTTNGGVTCPLLGILQGSNRPTANELIPVDPILIAQAVVGLGAGANITILALSSASGRATMTLRSGGQPCIMTLMALGVGFAYVEIASLSLVAGAQANVDVTLPLSQVEVILTNTGAAPTNFVIGLTADTSGG